MKQSIKLFGLQYPKESIPLVISYLNDVNNIVQSMIDEANMANELKDQTYDNMQTIRLDLYGFRFWLRDKTKEFLSRFGYKIIDDEKE